MILHTPLDDARHVDLVVRIMRAIAIIFGVVTALALAGFMTKVAHHRPALCETGDCPTSDCP